MNPTICRIAGSLRKAKDVTKKKTSVAKMLKSEKIQISELVNLVFKKDRIKYKL